MTEIVEQLSRRQARRIAVRAQLLDRPRPTSCSRSSGTSPCLQVDLTAAVGDQRRSGALVAARRTAASGRSDLDDAVGDGSLVEIASRLRPIEDVALYRAEMAAWRDSVPLEDWQEGPQTWLASNTTAREDILDELRRDGPLPARALPDTCDAALALERVDQRQERDEDAGDHGGPRRGRRRLARGPRAQLGPGRADLGRRSAAAPSLADARSRTTSTPARRSRSCERRTPSDDPTSGRAWTSRVEGVRGTWFVDPEQLARLDEPFRGRVALLSPLDWLVFDRQRLVELFEFDYQLEMYKPAARRRWGYWAMPVLRGDRLIGKLDAAADRAVGALRIHALHLDTEADRRAACGTWNASCATWRAIWTSSWWTSATDPAPTDRLPPKRPRPQPKRPVSAEAMERRHRPAQGIGAVGQRPADRRRELARQRLPRRAPSVSADAVASGKASETTCPSAQPLRKSAVPGISAKNRGTYASVSSVCPGRKKPLATAYSSDAGSSDEPDQGRPRRLLRRRIGQRGPGPGRVHPTGGRRVAFQRTARWRPRRRRPRPAAPRATRSARDRAAARAAGRERPASAGAARRRHSWRWRTGTRAAGGPSPPRHRSMTARAVRCTSGEPRGPPVDGGEAGREHLGAEPQHRPDDDVLVVHGRRPPAAPRAPAPDPPPRCAPRRGTRSPPPPWSPGSSMVGSSSAIAGPVDVEADLGPGAVIGVGHQHGPVPAPELAASDPLPGQRHLLPRHLGPVAVDLGHRDGVRSGDGGARPAAAVRARIPRSTRCPGPRSAASRGPRSPGRRPRPAARRRAGRPGRRCRTRGSAK